MDEMRFHGQSDDTARSSNTDDHGCKHTTNKKSDNDLSRTIYEPFSSIVDCQRARHRLMAGRNFSGVGISNLSIAMAVREWTRN
jgi:hypothetical protein